MSIKLRDLIKDVRACKTAAEERALIQREKAAIRNSFTVNLYFDGKKKPFISYFISRS